MPSLPPQDAQDIDLKPGRKKRKNHRSDKPRNKKKNTKTDSKNNEVHPLNEADSHEEKIDTLEATSKLKMLYQKLQKSANG
jgi:hypothetical protein